MLLTILFSVLAFADEPDYNDGFRAGVCLGNSTECLGTNIKLGYAGEFGGFNIGLPFIPVGDGFAKDILLPASFVGFDLRPMPLQGSDFPETYTASLRWYPMSVLENQHVSWRPYLYGGGAIYLDDYVNLVGIGVGADVHLTSSRRLCLQPSLGRVRASEGYRPYTISFFPSASLAVMYTY